ncbi:hypothetical protein Tsubulata_018247 [Turnera subulata]|uniref:SHSP domain-containing protein n=1 Tax=Turnera subulata TaxID=218843 RepID=A0A9Q0J7C4_9ROSI|nr:hypothetical protein Tsubulata_018247 [Turnera subulata]
MDSRSSAMGRVDNKPVIAVTPLNSMPYIGPDVPPGPSDNAPLPTDTNPTEKVGPSLVFFPSHVSKTESDNIMVSGLSGVKLTGAAATGSIGPTVGMMDIGESEDSYMFRVSLPGVSRNEKDFNWDIQPDGKVTIKGVTTTGERIVCKYSQIFKMQTQNLCAPGHFSITFRLPGPVDHQKFSGCFGIDGMLEVIVKKAGSTSISKQGVADPLKNPLQKGAPGKKK